MKVLNIFDFNHKPRRKFELIGRDGCFTMEESVLAEEVKEFHLDI